MYASVVDSILWQFNQLHLIGFVGNQSTLIPQYLFDIACTYYESNWRSCSGIHLLWDF